MQCRAHVEKTGARCQKNTKILGKYCWWHYPKAGLLQSLLVGVVVGIGIDIYLGPRTSFFVFNLLEPRPLTFAIKRELLDESQSNGVFQSFLGAHDISLLPILYVYELHIKNNTSKVLLKDVDILFDFSGPVLDWKESGSAHTNGIQIYALSKREGLFLPQRFMNIGSFGARGFYDAEVLVGFPEMRMAIAQPDVPISASYTYQGHGLMGRASIRNLERQIMQ